MVPGNTHGTPVAKGNDIITNKGHLQSSKQIHKSSIANKKISSFFIVHCSSCLRIDLVRIDLKIVNSETAATMNYKKVHLYYTYILHMYITLLFFI